MRRLRFMWLCLFSDLIDWMINLYSIQMEKLNPTDLESAIINTEDVQEKKISPSDDTQEIDMGKIILDELETQIRDLEAKVNSEIQKEKLSTSEPVFADYKDSEDAVQIIEFPTELLRRYKENSNVLTLIQGGVRDENELDLVEEINSTKPDYKVS